jgi:hypothetical protein
MWDKGERDFGGWATFNIRESQHGFVSENHPTLNNQPE